MNRIIAVIQEAFASARSGAVASSLTILVVAGMVLTVMLTTGRTVGAEQTVLASIDSASSRAILVRADSDAGVTTEALSRIASFEGIEWSGAFSAATDATNLLIPDGYRVPVRYLYTEQRDVLGGLPPAGMEHAAFASQIALEQLGLTDVAGGILFADGTTLGIAGEIVPPSFLADFEPIVFVPRPATAEVAPVSLILVVVDRPELVPSMTDLVVSVLDPLDPTKIAIQTSESFTELRDLVEGQLGSFSRGLVLALLGLTGMLVSVILFGLVMMRRKDFGRRRALGASRGLIIALLLLQTSMLAIVGISEGLAVAVVVLLVSGDPLPGVAFVGALAVLAFVTSVAAAVIPAAVASKREPIRELRVP